MSLLKIENLKNCSIFWKNGSNVAAAKLCVGRFFNDTEGLEIDADNLLWMFLTRHGEMTILFGSGGTSALSCISFVKAKITGFLFDPRWEPHHTQRVLRAPGELLLINAELLWSLTISEFYCIEFRLGGHLTSVLQSNARQDPEASIVDISCASAELDAAATIVLHADDPDVIGRVVRRFLGSDNCGACCPTKPFSATNLWADDPIERALAFYQSCTRAIAMRRGVGDVVSDALKISLFDGEFERRESIPHPAAATTPAKKTTATRASDGTTAKRRCMPKPTEIIDDEDEDTPNEEI